MTVGKIPASLKRSQNSLLVCRQSGTAVAIRFGDSVRPTIKPVDIVKLLVDAGAWGEVNLHDNDLVVIDGTYSGRDNCHIPRWWA